MKNNSQSPTVRTFAAISSAVLVIVLSLTSCEQQMDKSELKAEIEKANQTWMEAVKKQDAEAVAAMYSDDSFILPANVPAIQGREGIKNFFAGAMGAGIKNVKLITEAVDGDEETAVERGVYEMMAEGGTVVDKGKYLVHWKKVDGRWLFQNDMFSSDMPAPKTLAQKGNVFGVHVADVKLQSGVTRDRFEQYYKETVIPEFEKTYPDVKLYFIKGIRGEHKDRIGLIYYFESDEVRNKYFNPDETPTDAGKVLQARMKPTYDGLTKLRVSASTKYTDWVVE
jgi:uncharacterized protein (TIGR02246 family)